MNNVAFGMVALLRLFHSQGIRHARHLASVVRVPVRQRRSLVHSLRQSPGSCFVLRCVPHAEDVVHRGLRAGRGLGSVLDYLLRAGEGCRHRSRVLLPELIRHVTAKLDTYYPQNSRPTRSRSRRRQDISPLSCGSLSRTSLTGGMRPARLDRRSTEPASRFRRLARSYVRVPGRTAQVYCEYPFEVLDVSREQARLRIIGDPRLSAVFGCSPDGAGCEQESLVGSVSGRVDTATQEMGWRDYMVPAGQEITVRF